MSSVQRYARCPLDWKLYYIDRIREPIPPPMAFGRAFATALEAYHRGHDAEVAWLRAYAEVVNAKPDFEYGLELLRLYREQYDLTGEPEKRFSLHLPNRLAVPVPILGYMDLVRDDEVVEFKTSSAIWTQQRVDSEHQAAVYGWAFRQLMKRHLERVLYIVFSTRTPAIETFDTHPDGMDLRLFEIAAAATWEGIKARRFDGCGKCSVCTPKKDEPTFVVAREETNP